MHTRPKFNGDTLTYPPLQTHSTPLALLCLLHLHETLRIQLIDTVPRLSWRLATAALVSRSYGR